MAEADSPDKLLASIPDVHYDLIARMMPGALTLTMATVVYVAAWGPKSPGSLLLTGPRTSSFGSGLVLLTIASALSWCGGMLLTPIGDWVHKRLFRARIFGNFCKKYKGHLERAAAWGFISSPTDNQEWTSDRGDGMTLLQSEITYQELHDGLKEGGPKIKVILAKSQAELVFFESTTAGILILLMACALLEYFPPIAKSLDRCSQLRFGMSCALLILLFLLSLRGQYFKAERLWSRHASLLRIYMKSKGQWSGLPNNGTKLPDGE